MITKTCSMCKQEKQRKEFHVKRDRSDGLNSRCKDCCHLSYLKRRSGVKNRARPRIDKKTCSECVLVKQISEFTKNLNMKDGYQSLCKPCYHQKRYLPHRDKILKSTSVWHKKNPKKTKEIKNRWRKNNPQKVREISRKYYENNKEVITERNKQWVKQNPIKAREKTLRRRARKRNATIVKFTKQQLLDRMSVFDNRCAYCGGPFDHIDHLKPLFRGGPHCLSNLRPACKSCNTRKGAMDPFVWLKLVRSVNLFYF